MCPSCSPDSCDVASSSPSEGTVFYDEIDCDHDTTLPPPLIVFSSGRNFNLSPIRAIVDSSHDAGNDDSSHDAETDDSSQDAEIDDSNCDAEVEPANDIKGVYPYLNERQILHPETGLNHIAISSMVMSIDPKPSMAAWSYLNNESTSTINDCATLSLAQWCALLTYLPLPGMDLDDLDVSENFLRALRHMALVEWERVISNLDEGTTQIPLEELALLFFHAHLAIEPDWEVIVTVDNAGKIVADGVPKKGRLVLALKHTLISGIQIFVELQGEEGPAICDVSLARHDLDNLKGCGLYLSVPVGKMYRGLWPHWQAAPPNTAGDRKAIGGI
jgi:hypothetical protein